MMRRVILPFIGIAALAAICTPPIQAQTVGTPQFYVGVEGGKGFADIKASDPSSTLDGLGAQGWTGGLRAGLDLPLGRSTGMVPFAGVYGGYDWGNVEFSSTGTNGATVHGTFGDAWYAGGRLGVMTANGAKYYFLGGYRDGGDLDLSELKLQTVHLKGWDVGLGAEFPVAHYVTLGLEGIYTRYGEETVAPNERFQPSTLGVMGHLNFALGEPRPESLFADPPADPPACDPKLANCRRHR